MQTAKNVTVIPATYHAQTHQPATQKACRRVAGYARVSTDSDEQYTSYEAQVDYYTNFIRSHPDWEFVGVYTDEGVSGLGTRKRDGFNAMIRDALAGKIDLIVTKSVSRFARNTVDSLTTIRKLKEHGTEVYFEKEAIWTFDGKGELLLTIMSSLAQEESRSISENVTWGQRKRMADGKVTIPYKHFLGYRKGPDGLPEIVQEEAELVRRIYRMFIEGLAVSRIARTLTDEGIPTPAGKQKWQNSTIESILTNEKYKGDARLQKKFTTDFLTKKMKVNEGEVPQYYVRNSHPAIIEPGAWDHVQKEMQKRKANPRQRYCSSPFSGKIICGDCGCVYGSKVWHSTDQYRRVIWQCNGKFKGDEKCTTPHGIEKKLNEISGEMEIVAGMIDACVRENAVAAQDQNQYKSRYDDLISRFETSQAKQAALQKERAERERKADALDSFLFELSELDELNMEFSPQRWNAIVDHVTVHSDGRLVFNFQNGSDVIVEIV